MNSVVVVSVLAGLLMMSQLMMSRVAGEVIVVGGGLAGLSAAIEIAIQRVPVTLIDGEKDFGGNSAKASSGINAAPTSAQSKKDIMDSHNEFIADTIVAGDAENNPELVETLVYGSTDALQFLIRQGVDLSDVNLCGGHSHPRTHWIPSPKEGKPTPVGFMIMKALKNHYRELAAQDPDIIKIMLNTTVTDLVKEGDSVVGVKYVKRDGDGEGGELRGKSVILTTGGYSNDHSGDSLLKEFAQEKMAYPSTNGPFAIGGGLKAARRAGAKIIDMSHVQIHPTSFIDPKNPTDKTKFLAAEALRGSGALLLNQKGERFCNELGRRDYTTEAIEANCAVDSDVGRPTAWLIINIDGINKFGWPAFNFYWKIKKFFVEVDGLTELEEKTGMSAEAVQKSFDTYNQLASGTAKDVFGKTVFPVKYDMKDSQILYAAKITPAIHYTMGGLAIDKSAQVLRQQDAKPFDGLFAAGEVTGGVHGANRLGGNSLLECVVFGRIAAKSAMERETVKNEL